MENLREIPFRLEHGDSNFFGLWMAQRPETIEAFNIFFNYCYNHENIKFHRIIELGIGGGTLTVFFAIYGFNHDCEIHAFDHISDGKQIFPKLLLETLDVNCYCRDILHDEATIKFVGDLISKPGNTLVICDNGGKGMEINLYTPFLKPGDFIMGHDYIETHKRFIEEYKGKIWNCCGIIYKEISDTCEKYNLKPFLQKELWDDLVWICRRRVE